MLKGIDVSTVQGTIAWKKVKQQAGVDFAMIKATQGRGEGASTKKLNVFRDSQFIRNISSAYAAGVACGVYHYFTATTAAEVDREAQFFIDTIRPYRDKIELWAAVDVESEVYLKNLTRTQLTALVSRFLRKVSAAGFAVMLYANPNFLFYRFEPGAFDDTPLWLAHWGVSKPYADTKPKIWQFGAGRIEGIQTDVDHNYGYFSLNNLHLAKFTVGEKYTVKAGDVYVNGKAVPERLIGQEYTIQQVGSDRILLREILSWVKV
jgi:lysozyme